MSKDQYYEAAKEALSEPEYWTIQFKDPRSNTWSFAHEVKWAARYFAERNCPSTFVNSEYHYFLERMIKAVKQANVEMERLDYSKYKKWIFRVVKVTVEPVN